MNVLLLSGGIESSCLAFWKRPELCITVDYGQVSAEMELETASAIARKLELRHQVIRASLGRKFGLSTSRGFLRSKPEFWPYRNQLLATLAAMHTFDGRSKEIWFGSVKSDKRFLDGSPGFFRRLSTLMAFQEGEVVIRAPAASLSTEKLIEISKTPWSILGATFSCHRGNIACGDCPGCAKQRSTLFSKF